MFCAAREIQMHLDTESRLQFYIRGSINNNHYNLFRAFFRLQPYHTFSIETFPLLQTDDLINIFFISNAIWFPTL